MTNSKPLTAYRELEDKRLCNRVILALSRNELDPAAKRALARVLNKAKRATSATAKKKYSNGWLVFYKERFPVVRKSNPEVDITGLASRIGQEWRTLTPEQKAVYTEKAKKLRS